MMGCNRCGGVVRSRTVTGSRGPEAPPSASQEQKEVSTRILAMVKFVPMKTDLNTVSYSQKIIIIYVLNIRFRL